MKLTNKEEIIKELLQSDQLEVNTDDLWLGIKDSVEVPKGRNLKPLMFWFIGCLAIGSIGLVLATYSGQSPEVNSLATEISQKTHNSLMETNEQLQSNHQEITLPQEVNPVNPLYPVNENTGGMIDTSETESGLAAGLTVSSHKSNLTLNATANINIRESNSVIKEVNTILEQSNNTFTSTKITSESNLIITEMSSGISQWISPRLPRSQYDIPSFVDQPVLADTMITVISKNNHGRWILGASSGLMTFTSTNTLPTGEKLDLKNETSTIGYTSQIHLTRSITDRLAIQGGINYAYGAMRYRDSSTLTGTQYGDGTAVIETDSHGTATAIEGQISQHYIRTNDIQWHQVHQYVDISVGLQYVHRLRNNWLVDLSLGGVYNIYEHHSGYHYTIEDADVPVFVKELTTQSSPFVNSTKVGLQSGVGIQKSISNLLIGLKAQSIYRPNNIINPTSGYQSKITQTGLLFSINYQPEWDL